jgi:hypothetical protein
LQALARAFFFSSKSDACKNMPTLYNYNGDCDINTDVRLVVAIAKFALQQGGD